MAKANSSPMSEPTFEFKGNTLVITVPDAKTKPGRASSSGKSMLVATATERLDGGLKVGLNVYRPNA